MPVALKKGPRGYNPRARVNVYKVAFMEPEVSSETFLFLGLDEDNPMFIVPPAETKDKSLLAEAEVILGSN